MHHGLWMAAGAIVKTQYDNYRKRRAKEVDENLPPVSDAYCVGPMWSDDMKSIMDDDWMNKPRQIPGVAIRRVR